MCRFLGVDLVPIRIMGTELPKFQTESCVVNRTERESFLNNRSFMKFVKPSMRLTLEKK